VTVALPTETEFSNIEGRNGKSRKMSREPGTPEIVKSDHVGPVWHVTPGMQEHAVARVDEALRAAINKRTKDVGQQKR
jgi:hypothetical protein